MADNVPITAGSGTTIATDDVTDVGGAHYQKIKIADGTANSTAMIGGDAANGLDVDVTRLPSLVAGTAYAARVRLTDGTNDSTISSTGGLETTGDVAHGTSDSGNPMKIGYKTIAHGTNPTAVAAAIRTDAYANRAGIPFVMGGHPNIQTIRLQFTAAQTNVAIITIATGLKIVVTALQVTLDNASTVFPSVVIGFGTASTPTTTGVIGAHAGLPAGGGFSRGDGSGIIGVGADNEDLRITTVGAATGGGVEVVVTYYTIES